MRISPNTYHVIEDPNLRRLVDNKVRQWYEVKNPLGDQAGVVQRAERA